MHQVADLPHERLMTIDDRLSCGAVLIEPRGRHRLLDLADGLLGLGNACFELFDLGLAGLLGAGRAPRFRIGPLLFFARRLGLLSCRRRLLLLVFLARLVATTMALLPCLPCPPCLPCSPYLP